MMSLTAAITLSFLVVGISSSSDTSERGEDCSKFDRCRSGDLFRTCSCDSDCYKYGTCCSDSDQFNLMAGEKDMFMCYNDRTYTSVYAKKYCSESFSGRDFHDKICTESISDKADILGNLLVSSTKTKITYWNYHCAMCNHEDIDDLKQWAVQVACPAKHGDTRFSRNYVEDHLTFDLDHEEWGLKVKDGFVVCTVSFFQPSNLVGKLNYCAPNLVTTCPTEYPHNDTKTKCLSYHAERKQKNTDIYFRNVHCALCNGVTEDELDCVGRTYPPASFKKTGDQVKVVFNAGQWLNREGPEKYKCSNGNIYDPFQNRCRKMPESMLKDFQEAERLSTLNYGQRVTVSLNVCIAYIVFVFFNKYIFY
ncbi:uncharacterized protein TNIN_72091 [Trichonephila inaurata madagascariensis]|uniref:SMB domain-containing protein n=1 Tax=Trichonephila inaurata madagascariensis TaxID=2747483 RepID=A0A8X7C5X4_9ARAC|nr:uncharacterized protein TNIN_72091 [Trichonephila inaurata madagascariensis]